MTADEALQDLSRALGLGDRPGDVTRSVRAVYQTIDADVAVGTAGLALPCRVGCDACCHEAVFLSGPEFLTVAEHLLNAWSPSDRLQLVTAMGEIADRFEDELEILETISGSERDEVAARVRFTCPFLDAVGSCRIYSVRELNARTFGLTWDEDRGHPFGCGLTHERLRILGQEGTAKLAGARAARRQLVDSVGGTERVHVYPWWFAKYGRFLK